MNINHIFQIAKWEFVQKAKTKAFIFSLVLTPIIMSLFNILPMILMNTITKETKRVLIVDQTHFAGNALSILLDFNKEKEKHTIQTTLEQISPNTPINIKSYTDLIIQDRYDAFIILPSTLLQKREYDYYSLNISNISDFEVLEKSIEKVITDTLLSLHKISESTFKDISSEVKVHTTKIKTNGDISKGNTLTEFIGMYGSLLIIIMMVTFSGQLLVRSLLDEKSNRIIEILLSSVSSIELMYGKLIGLGCLGLLQGITWLVFGLIASVISGFQSDIFAHIPFIFMYAILGYFYYASILIGIGSTATTEQEAQNITGYIMMFTIIPFLFMMIIMDNPSGTVAIVCSYIPFLTPSIMSARIAVQFPNIIEIILSTITLILSIGINVMISSKIFSIGILTYGKRLTFKEIWIIVRSKG